MMMFQYSSIDRESVLSYTRTSNNSALSSNMLSSTAGSTDWMGDVYTAESLQPQSIKLTRSSASRQSPQWLLSDTWGYYIPCGCASN